MGSLNLWPSIAGAAAWALSASIAYNAGETSVENEWNEDIIARTNAALKRESEYRATEKQWANAFRLNVDWYSSEQGRIRDDYESTITGIHDGALVLRERFRGCQQQLSETAATPGSADEGSGGGLSKPDQEFLVRIGRRCDQVVATLTALQRHVRALE